ncbi:hypothetical protein [Streptomyces albicerus]|uniref:hypothetical protein n=1 Tax=Streptomyces albicerus TaxID=2569859 RepID=UPI00124B6FB6|nr:hypothetical protein [Streptomyces albicerus]
MGRGIMLIAFLVTVFHLVPAATAVAADCSGDQVLCWAESRAGGKPLDLVVDRKLNFGKEGWTALEQADRHAELGTVSVADSAATGPGGTVLFLLAEKRRVGPKSVVSRLDKDIRDALKASRACGPPCKSTVSLLARDVEGRELLADGLAEEVGRDAGKPGTGSGDDSLLWLTLGAAAVLLLLLTLLTLAVRRTRVSPALAVAGPGPTPGPRHRAAPRPPPPVRRHREPETPRRTAAVRTELHPQGYVELDHCLYRAEWTDPDTPPPALGTLVDVTDPGGTPGDPDVLIVLPRSRHRRAADDHA